MARVEDLAAAFRAAGNFVAFGHMNLSVALGAAEISGFARSLACVRSHSTLLLGKPEC
jgi:hypothetical protein